MPSAGRQHSLSDRARPCVQLVQDSHSGWHQPQRAQRSPLAQRKLHAVHLLLLRRNLHPTTQKTKERQGKCTGIKGIAVPVRTGPLNAASEGSCSEKRSAAWMQQLERKRRLRRCRPLCVQRSAGQQQGCRPAALHGAPAWPAPAGQSAPATPSAAAATACSAQGPWSAPPPWLRCCRVGGASTAAGRHKHSQARTEEKAGRREQVERIECEKTAQG